VGLQISLRESGGEVTIMDLRGRATIDTGESEYLSARLTELVAKGTRKLLLNLSELNQVDSSGVRVIVSSYVSLRDRDGALKLLNPWGKVLDVLQALHLLEVIPSFEDEAEGVASFGSLGYSAKS
jgi:anti-sigma B factor antagonist